MLSIRKLLKNHKFASRLLVMMPRIFSRFIVKKLLLLLIGITIAISIFFVTNKKIILNLCVDSVSGNIKCGLPDPDKKGQCQKKECLLVFKYLNEKYGVIDSDSIYSGKEMVEPFGGKCSKVMKWLKEKCITYKTIYCPAVCEQYGPYSYGPEMITSDGDFIYELFVQTNQHETKVLIVPKAECLEQFEEFKQFAKLGKYDLGNNLLERFVQQDNPCKKYIKSAYRLIED